MTGVIYLLHLDAPGYAHAKHYTGWTADLPARLALHEAGQAARLGSLAGACSNPVGLALEEPLASCPAAARLAHSDGTYHAAISSPGRPA